MEVPVAASDVHSAVWLQDALEGFASSVTSIVPSGFEAYARLLHPLRPTKADTIGRVSWQAIAERVGIEIDEHSQWEGIAEVLPTAILEGYEPPAEGTLDPETTQELSDILKLHTNTPRQCWYGYWTGYEYLQEVLRCAPVFHLNGRDYHLFHGDVDLAAELFRAEPFFQSANIFWPGDHAWCVASEIDFCSSYIAASNKSISDLMSVFRGSMFRVTPDQRVARSVA